MTTKNANGTRAADPVDVTSAQTIIARVAVPKVNGFLLPQAWTFDACDVEHILHSGADIKYMKFFSAIVENAAGQRSLTLVMVGIDTDGKEVFQDNDLNLVMYEYADPCPPMCGLTESVLIPPGGYQEITVLETGSKKVEETEPYTQVTCHGQWLRQFKEQQQA